MKRKIILLCVAWLILVACLFLVEYQDSEETHKDLIFSIGRAQFERVVLTRGWNAMHGGVYVPVTKDTRPNPYLEDPLRDIRVNNTLTLTKINPAYMTRQLAELSAKSGTVRIHITSLKPIRPENRATLREQKALESFEKGSTEVGEFIKDSQDLQFFYMAPLKMEKACLKCHAKHGYKEGDVRGGISILFPLPHRSHVVSLAGGHVVIGLLGLFRIILFGDKLDKSYKIIQEQAVVDVLTGIPNHRTFLERMPMECKRRTRSNKPLSFVMPDIDHFKKFNDTYGHKTGDDCLRKVAQAIVVVLPHVNGADALTVAERVRTAVASRSVPVRGGKTVNVTVSLGVAAYPDDADTGEKLVGAADEALYRSKRSGRNRAERSGGGHTA